MTELPDNRDLGRQVEPPAPRPCESCPYRQDVPSGVWAREEYDKLPAYDHDTAFQPVGAFECHYQVNRLCAGWVACHDMEASLSMRFLVLNGGISVDGYESCLDYETDVPVFSSGAEARAHGVKDIQRPGLSARKVQEKIVRKVGQ